MNGIILAAGLGTRLRPLTDYCPKALLRVEGKTMLERAIESLQLAGADRIVINVHHLADQIIDYIDSNRSNFATDIIISDERSCLLNTGGGITQAMSLLPKDDKSPVIITNSDLLTDVPLSYILTDHVRSGADITLLVNPDRTTRRKLMFDRQSLQMRGWLDSESMSYRTPLSEKMDLTQCIQAAFGGIHVMNRAILSNLMAYRPAASPFSITDFYIDQCDSLSIHACIPTISYNWLDIGKHDIYDQLVH